MVEDVSGPEHRVRKVDNLKGPSLDNLKSSERNEPPLIASRDRSASCILSKKHANDLLTNNRKNDLIMRSSENLHKINKSTTTSLLNIRSSSFCNNTSQKSPSATKRKENDTIASSSIGNSIRYSSSESKLQKMDDGNKFPGASPIEDNDKKTIRKHLHVRAYRNFFRKQAKEDGSIGNENKAIKDNTPLEGDSLNLAANNSKEVKEVDYAGIVKEVAQDKTMLSIETNELEEENKSKYTKLLSSSFATGSPSDASNREQKAKFSGSKCRSILEQPGDETYNYYHCKMNMESSLPISEELDVEDNGVCNSEYMETSGQHITKEDAGVLKNSINTTQKIIAPMHDVCFICKQPGQLICCCGKSCKRSYHLSCFNPLLHDAPLGPWLCNFCVKTTESGSHCVLYGIESVWDVEEGVQNENRYFVKYKGLSHVHNRWISERVLQHDAPLLSNFRKNALKEETKWRKEWTEPERLLQKRVVAPLEVVDEFNSITVSESSKCCTEWLVKWKGLEYDQATWELEKFLLLGTSKISSLIEEHKCRCEQARRLYDPLRAEKALQLRRNPFCKLPKLPEGCPTELEYDHLSYVNLLREHWHKSLNAVFIDGQERISKSILFLVSLQSHASRPSLIITTSGSLSVWQTDLLRLAPSINSIVYYGKKETRKLIRNLEFYEESGCIMFQVLLTDHKAVVEDLVDISCIGWESIIIDKCQKSKTIRILKHLNALKADFKLLLFNGQQKDSLFEYRILLSFLNTERTNDDGLVNLKDTSDDDTNTLTKAKEKLARHIAYEGKTFSSKFLEYWVPVPLSSVQLEQYCETLISNATLLRSNIRSDVVESLHNILITARKCCDHPYLVDGELRGLLTKGLQGAEIFNAEVCASGKLYLLEKVLLEMKSRGLRVVILFQSLGGFLKVSLGDILDDFLQQKFGGDSYERIETGMLMSKKVAALKTFNNKESGRFVFLIEKRACLPSVKLQYIDAVILFDSDWNPLNDLRSLKKISIESRHSFINIFRLYSSYTVEEKLLMFAKQDTFLESSVESLSRNITHSLLGWGASYLLKKLDQLHSKVKPVCISEPSFDKLCFNDVILEILAQFPEKTVISRTIPCSILTKARLSGERYTKGIVLMGEKEGISLPDKDLANFWSGLLMDRYPIWMYISNISQKNRRRSQNVSEIAVQKFEGDESKNKRRKISNFVGTTLPELSQEKDQESDGIHKSCMLEPEGRGQKLKDQRNLLMLLRTELSELCDILGFPKSVKDVAHEFLIYIINNHDVSTNHKSVLQALKISLCWRAASMKKHRLDRDASLALAKELLKFECTEPEVYSVYSKLQILKDKFSFQSDAMESFGVHNSEVNHSSPSKKAHDEREEPLVENTEETTNNGLILEAADTIPIGHKPSERIMPEKCGSPINETPGRNDSTIIDFTLDPKLNDGAILSTVQGIEGCVPENASSLTQDLCTNKQTSHAHDSGNNTDMSSLYIATVPESVSLSSHVEAAICNESSLLNSTNCKISQPENAQVKLPPEVYQKFTQQHPFVELCEVSSQQNAIGAIIESSQSNCQSPENGINLLIPQEDPHTEGILSQHLISAANQLERVNLSHSSNHQADAQVQNEVEEAVIIQIPEDIIYPMSSREGHPLESTTAIHSDKPHYVFDNIPSIEWIPPQPLFLDPMQNELIRVRRQEGTSFKNYEKKKLLLQSECEVEIEKVRRKYDALLQDSEKEYLRDNAIYQKIYQMIYLHKVFAEEIRAHYYDRLEGSSTSLKAPRRTSCQHPQASRDQSQFTSRPSSMPSLPAESRIYSNQPTNQDSTTLFIPLRPQSVTSIHSAGVSGQEFPVISNNTVRAPLISRPSLQVGRFPAPHLQFSKPPPFPSVPTLNSLPFPPPLSISSATLSVPPSIIPAAFHSSAPLIELPQYAEDDYLLETLLAGLPATVDYFPPANAIDQRPNASHEAICLSDDD